MIDIPWSPIVPESRTRSPARISAAETVSELLDRADPRRGDAAGRLWIDP
jgi:hypothetical protein